MECNTKLCYTAVYPTVKFCCNQNMLALPLIRLICGAYGYHTVSFFQRLDSTHKGFPISKATHLTQVSVIIFLYIPTQ